MNLIQLTKPEPEPQAKRIANELLEGVNTEMQRRVATHRVSFGAFWNSPVPPDDILSAMGQNAILFLAAAGENVDHIQRIASVIGKTVLDFLPACWWQPRRAFQPQADGTVTLAPPPFGHDAWCRFIFVPEDPLRTGYLDDGTPIYGHDADGTPILVAPEAPTGESNPQ